MAGSINPVYAGQLPAGVAPPAVLAGAVPTDSEFCQAIVWQAQALDLYRPGDVSADVLASAADLVFQEGHARLAARGGIGFPPNLAEIIQSIPGQFAALRRDIAIVHNANCDAGYSFPYMIVLNAAGVDPTAPAPTGPGLPPLHNRGSIGALSQADRDAYKLFYGIPDKDLIYEVDEEEEAAEEEEAPDPAVLLKNSIAKAIGARVQFWLD